LPISGHRCGLTGELATAAQPRRVSQHHVGAVIASFRQLGDEILHGLASCHQLPARGQNREHQPELPRQQRCIQHRDPHWPTDDCTHGVVGEAIEAQPRCQSLDLGDFSAGEQQQQAVLPSLQTAHERRWRGVGEFEP